MGGLLREIIRFLAIDLQGDFTRSDGASYVDRPSTSFVSGTLVPFLRDNGIKTLEIVSDYRGPRIGDNRDICRPGEPGYESDIPEDVKDPDIWIKSMNSPVWVREGGGDSGKIPGDPFPETIRFQSWLVENIPDPASTTVVLYGLTLDCCVLCTAQELTFRGYDVRILKEGTDTRSGDQHEKMRLLKEPPITFWSSPISWEELRNAILKKMSSLNPPWVV